MYLIKVHLETRTIRFKLDKYIQSSDPCDRIFALNTILSEGKGLKAVPKEEELEKSIEATIGLISDELAKKYVQNKIEAQVEQSIMEKTGKVYR